MHTRRYTRLSGLALTLLFTLLSGQGLVFGYDHDDRREGKDHAPTCTLKTLKGRYLFAASGMLLPPAFGVTEPTPGADAGFHIFNGDGTGTDTVTVRIGNDIVLENFVTPISYTVNADCTGTYTVPNGPSFDLFIAPNGETIARIATAPSGNYVSSIDPRVSRK